MYNPKLWYTGDIVSSGGLNNMEQGIAQNAHDIETINDSIEDLSADATELKSDLKQLRCVNTITVDMLEKGSWSDGAKSTYRQANRARTLNKYIALNDIAVSIVDNSGASVYTEYYNADGTKKTSVSWSTASVIPKGSYFTISLTTSSSGTLTETPVSDIFAKFSIFDATKNIITDFDSQLHPRVGIIFSTNILRCDYTTRLTIEDYFKPDKSMFIITCASGYKFYCVAYNADFTVAKYGFTSWQTGVAIMDFSSYAYVRFIVAKSDDSAVSIADAQYLSVVKNTPVSVEYDCNIISVSKDGINDDDKSYITKYPKSSVVSFQKAFDQGFRTLMMHVQFTSDNVPVLFHDQSINSYARNADGTTISSTVNIADHTLAELNVYDFGIAFGSQYAGMDITTLEEGLLFAKEHGMSIVIEPTTTLNSTKNQIVAGLIKAYGLADRCSYVSYYTSTLSDVHSMLPKARLIMWAGTESDMNDNISALSALIGNNDVYFYTYNNTSISDSTIAALYAANIRLMLQIYGAGTEPADIITSVRAHPYVSMFASQAVPAYSAMQNA